MNHLMGMNSPAFRLVTRCAASMIVVGIVLWHSPIPAAAKTAPEAAREHYEAAVTHVQEGALRAAVIELKNALQRDPDNADARLLLGEVYLQLGDGGAAEKELRAAQRLGHGKARIAQPLGQALLLQGRFEAVLAELAAEDVAPEIAVEVLLLRADAHAGLAQWDAARALYDTVAATVPEEPRIYLGRARLALATGDLPAAEAQAGEALARRPAMVEALLVQGEARRLAGRPEAALESFRRALDAGPPAPAVAVRIRLGLAAALVALDRNVEAVRDMAPGLPLAAYLEALIKLRQQDFAAARRLLDAAAPSLEGFAPAQFLFGVVYYATGELESARSWLRRHLNVQPENLQARKLLAATLLRLDAVEEAVKLLGQAQAPDDAQVLLLLGNAYLRSGRAAEASALLQRAAELAPEDPRVLSQLAISHMATGQRNEALAALNATLDLDDAASAIGYAMAFVHLRGGAFGDALQVAQDLRKRFPQSAVAANLEGAAHVGLGQQQQARASFEAVLAIDPAFHEARANLAALKAQAGDLSGAEVEYQAILATQADNPMALMGLAALANHRGDRVATGNLLVRAVKADPDGLRPSLALAEHHAAGGDMAAAVRVMEELAGRQPNNPEVFLALARIQGTAGQPAAAVRSFQRLVELTSGATRARLLLADAQLASGELEAARLSYEGLKEAAADNPVVWNNLAWLYQQAGDDRAAAHGERALELAPGQPAIMDTLGWILLGEGQVARATDLLKAAHQAAPAVADIAYHYAAALHRSGDTAAARKLLQATLEGGQPFASRAEALALLEKIGS
jgi:putative PEP-CTERM system TPR-repeat lipoprotein